MSVVTRNNVKVLQASSGPTLLYAHGFGCSQAMWQEVVPAFKQNTRQVLFDFVGSGQSDIRQYSFSRYANLSGYAEDVIEICDALQLTEVVYVGHSVGCSIGVLAANKRPGLFKALVMLGPSPCFINFPPDYQGGFERAELEGLIALMEQNYLGWANYLAPVVAGHGNDPAISGKLSDSFCSTDPLIAREFALATFFADNRADFAEVTVPTLILQHKDDALASVDVGEYVHQQIKNSKLRILDVAGHAAHMSHPELVIKELQHYLQVDLQC